MRLARRYRLPLCAGVIVGMLSVHFGITLVYLAPLNPVTLRIAPAVEVYMAPWFAQDWHLFAPNPIDETRTLLVSCRLHQDTGTMVETPWADISTPLWNTQSRWRFSSAAWLVRPQSHAIQLYFDHNEVLARLEHHRTREDSPVNRLANTIRAAEAERQALATRVLARLGAAYCDRWHGPGQTVATRICLTTLHFPRFSERQLPDANGVWRLYHFPWLPYERVSSLRNMGE